MSQILETEETERCIASDIVEGTTVYNREGDKLGSILNFMVDKRTGKAQYAVMEFGGLLGIGSDYYPLPWDMLEYDEVQHGYIVDIDKDALEAAPRFGKERPSWTDDFGRSIYGYYGLAYPYI